MSAVRSEQRHKRSKPCLVCGGGDDMSRGQEKRCHGYLSDDGAYEHCSREELAGGLAEESGGTYAHRMHGQCRCGVQHGEERSKVRSLPEIVATYSYTDETGAELFQVVRFAPKDFRQRRRVGDRWEWKLGNARRVPYKLPELIAAASDRPVYIVEGEKDVDRLWSMGHVATCNPGGAGKWKAVDDAAAALGLEGRDVVIVADRDKPGRSHALDVAMRLRDVAKSVRVVEPPSPHKDVSDLLLAGGSLHQLVERPLVEEPEAPKGMPDDSFFGGPVRFRCTDTGNAERLVALYGHRIRFCGEWNEWLVNDGTRWVRDVRGEIHHFAKLTARSIYVEAKNAEDSNISRGLGDWARKSESRDKRAAMVRCAQSEPSIAISVRDLDRDPFQFNVANGTLELGGEKIVLRPHRPSDLITKLSPIVYDEKAEAPRWTKFLEEVLPDPDVRAFVQRFAGCCLTGDVSDRKFVFASGTGRNGKSVTMKVLRAVLGEYATVGAPDLLMAKKEQSHPTELADLHSARGVFCQEVPKGRTLNEQRVKELTGDEGVIRVRRMGENFWDLVPKFKIAITGNHPPRVNDDTDSIWDRMCKIPFNVRIADDAVDRQLYKTLTAELPGILAWAVKGCEAWRKHGLRPPRAVDKATLEYRSGEDLLGRFLSDCCLIHADARATAKGLVDACAEWCRASGEREVSRKALHERLVREGCTEKRTNKARGWQGIRLLEAAEIEARDKASDEVTRSDAESRVLLRETGEVLTTPLSGSLHVTLSPADDDDDYLADLEDERLAIVGEGAS